MKFRHTSNPLTVEVEGLKFDTASILYSPANFDKPVLIINL